jgi:hypothetical protein
MPIIGELLRHETNTERATFRSRAKAVLVASVHVSPLLLDCVLRRSTIDTVLARIVE